MAVDISDREIGKLEQTLKDIQHRSRNDRQLILFMQEEMESIRLDFERTKARLYTAISAAVVVATVLAWVIETFK